MACQMVYHNGNCLNTKKTFIRTCNLCTEACPHQAISEYRRLNAKECTECGVCMAVCPSGGFVDRNLDHFHDYLFSEEKEIVLNCPLAVPSGHEISCLGMLGREAWLVLLLLAEEKPVTIMTGNCAACQDRQACAASVQVFSQIHEEWPDHAPLRIQVRPDQEDAEVETEAEGEQNPALRGSWRDWRKKGRDLLEGWAPSLTADETYPVPKYRQWLLEALEKKKDGKIPFSALSAATSCTGCGICVTTCPQGALRMREDREPKENGSAGVDSPGEKAETFRLIWEPQKCVNCSRCVEMCQPGTLFFKTRFLSHRLLTGKVLIHEGSPRYCLKCGRQIYAENSLCLVCSSGELGEKV